MATEAQLPEDRPVHLSEPERQNILILEGMTCARCAMRIEKGLKKLPGVIEASVNLATERASVTYEPARTGLEEMQKKVEALGYKALPLPEPRAEIIEPGIAEGTEANTRDEQFLHRQAEIIR